MKYIIIRGPLNRKDYDLQSSQENIFTTVALKGACFEGTACMRESEREGQRHREMDKADMERAHSLTLCSGCAISARPHGNALQQPTTGNLHIFTTLWFCIFFSNMQISVLIVKLFN